ARTPPLRRPEGAGHRRPRRPPRREALEGVGPWRVHRARPALRAAALDRWRLSDPRDDGGLEGGEAGALLPAPRVRDLGRALRNARRRRRVPAGPQAAEDPRALQARGADADD